MAERSQGYEFTDIKFRWFIYGVLVLAVTIAGVYGIVFVTEASFLQQPGNPPSPAEVFSGPPLPALQIYPERDREDYERTVGSRHGSYDWVDPAAGIVRMPVAQAMKIVAEQGLPDWPARLGKPALEEVPLP
jgi:hypothetical protein